MNIAKKYGVTLLKSVLIFLVSAILAVFFMFLSYLLPTNKMMDNAKISSEILSAEGDYKYLFNGDASSRLDNFTDSIMISEAVFESDESFIYRSIKNYHNGFGVDGLKSQVNGEKIINNYSRYWNGYLIFLKPLLLVFSIKGIRILNTILQIVLIIGLCAIMLKKAKLMLVPYLLSIFMINPVTITQSLQFSSVFYIFNIAMLIVLLFYEKLKQKNWFGYLFLIIGIVTSFFDFLTYPISTFLMPLVVFMWFDDSNTFKEKFFSVLKFGIFWAVGYFGFWIAKWCIGSIITGENLITDAIEQARYRTTGDVDYEKNKLLLRLPFILNTNPIINLRNIIAVLVCLITFIAFVVKFRKQYKLSATSIFGFMIIAVLPILWYIVLSNHSYMHYWFTFRTYIGTIFAVTTLVCFGFKNIKINKGVSNEK